MRPIVLEANRPRHFYRGGELAAAFTGAPNPDERRPEDWIASATERFGQPEAGLSRLPDGRLLREALQAEPEAWLGPEHVARFGADPALLVKLLDAGQRLPVHAHPSRDFAARHLGCRNGKTEAWVVLETRGAEPRVHLGFRRDVEDSELAGWVAEQDSEAMLGLLHEVPVGVGDTVLVPAGTPHAIGAGVFCVELQEPTDFGVMLEWRDFDLPNTPEAVSMGLDRSLALQCVERRALSPATLEWLRGRGNRQAGPAEGVEDLFPPDADPFFRAQRLRPRGSLELEAAFSVLVVSAGSGLLRTAAGGSLELRRGAAILVPHAAGPASVGGELELLRCMPPAPGSGGTGQRADGEQGGTGQQADGDQGEERANA